MVYFFHLIVPTPVVVPTLENNHSDTDEFKADKGIQYTRLSCKKKLLLVYILPKSRKQILIYQIFLPI